jgi:hypothetical protein
MPKCRIDVGNPQFRTCALCDFDRQGERSLSEGRSIERNHNRTNFRGTEVSDSLEVCTCISRANGKRRIDDMDVATTAH